MTYFPSGLVDATTNSRGQVQSVQYDDLGRPDFITKPQGEDNVAMVYRANELKIWRESASPYWREFTYDPFGRVARETRNQGNRTYLMDTEWDQFDRPVLVTFPVTGMKIRYAYIGAYLKMVCEPGNQTVCNNQASFQYITDVQYDSIGRRETVAHGGAMNRTFGYNNRYYLAHQTVDQTYGDYLWSYTVGNNYDALGNVAEAVVDETIGMGGTPLDATHAYGYDTQNRISTWNLNNTGIKSFGYDGCGNLTNHEGHTQSFSHSTHRHAVSHRVLDDETYTYDVGGNVASITGGADDRYFTFDSSNRMVCVGSAPNGCDKMRVIYDAAGQRIRQEENGINRDFIGDGFELSEPAGGLKQARIDVNAMGENIAYRYIGNAALRTAAGEAIGIEPRVIRHWVLLILVSGIVGHFVLIGGRLRERRRRWAVSTVTAIAGLMGFPMLARAGGGGPSQIYRRFVVHDPIGSGLLELGESGSRVQTKVLRPFGGLAAQQGLAGNTPYGQRFAGHRFEENSGFYYMNARWMDAEGGRFVSVDPIVASVERPHAQNGYAYAESNPLSLVDPSGEGVRAAIDGGQIGEAPDPFISARKLRGDERKTEELKLIAASAEVGARSRTPESFEDSTKIDIRQRGSEGGGVQESRILKTLASDESTHRASDATETESGEANGKEELLLAFSEAEFIRSVPGAEEMKRDTEGAYQDMQREIKEVVDDIDRTIQREVPRILEAVDAVPSLRTGFRALDDAVEAIMKIKTVVEASRAWQKIFGSESPTEVEENASNPSR